MSLVLPFGLHWRGKGDTVPYASCVYLNSDVMTFSTQFAEREVFDFCANGVIMTQASVKTKTLISYVKKTVRGTRHCLIVTIHGDGCDANLTRQDKETLFLLLSKVFRFRFQYTTGDIIQIHHLVCLRADMLTLEEVYEELPHKNHRFTVSSVKKVPWEERAKILNKYRMTKKLSSTDISKLNDYHRYNARRLRARMVRLGRKYSQWSGVRCQVCGNSEEGVQGKLGWVCFPCKVAYHKGCYESAVYEKGRPIRCKCERMRLINYNEMRLQKLNSKNDLCSVCLLGEVQTDNTKNLITSNKLQFGCSVCNMLIHGYCFYELRKQGQGESCINCRNTSAPMKLRQLV